MSIPSMVLPTSLNMIPGIPYPTAAAPAVRSNLNFGTRIRGIGLGPLQEELPRRTAVGILCAAMLLLSGYCQGDWPKVQ